MKLFVYLLEGRELEVKDSYVKLKVGKSKSKTRVLMNSKNPVWNEEFVFRVHDLEEKLVVSVHHFDEESTGLFHLGGGKLVGRVKIPLRSVASEEDQNLAPTWFSLEKRKYRKSTSKETGKILLALSLHGKGQETSVNHLPFTHPSGKISSHSECSDTDVSSPVSSKFTEGKHFLKAVAGGFERLFKKHEEVPSNDGMSEVSTTFSDYEDPSENTDGSSFEELLEMMHPVKEDMEIPENLQGGILLDTTYAISPKDLNMHLFAPNSQFARDLAEFQGTTDVEERPWTWKSEGKSCLARVVTYTKAASKLVKAVKAFEEQTYVKASQNEFSVFSEVATPDVPYGSSFKVNVLYRMSPGQASSSGEESTHLVVSWDVKFHQHTMMKGMIESGVRQGLEDSYNQFAKFLAQNFKVVNPDTPLDKASVLSNLEAEHQSDWELAVKYFWNWTVVSTIVIASYVFLHILLCPQMEPQGLEFYGLDLPDSLGEIITCGILVILLQKVFNFISHFVEARLQRGSDHGIKAQGDGWVLTVALVEGMNIASPDSSSVPDPYVVMTCNGKTRTSSVKLHSSDPEWNEILEFDASEEPPSVLDVEVFDFDGPFVEAVSLGHGEINFIKHTSNELADMWVTLEGNPAQTLQPKLHLRIFLDNTNGVETIREYLTKIEKEAGTKLSLRSPHSNSSFQKLFGLPPEEFLINDFLCSLKRKMPLQGRLFLSARIVGFYTNLFGHKTKFYFLWEDIEDIHVLPPSLSSVGSPLLVIILHKDRGIDARHGAKSQDEEGRLHFYFHSFLYFNEASRTVMALWKARSQALDQNALLPELKDEVNTDAAFEDSSPFLAVEDEKLPEVLSIELSVDMSKLMQMFDGGELEHKVMSKSGCLDYIATEWRPAGDDVLERHISYKFNRQVSVFGAEVTCTQQKSLMPSKDGWTLNEIMTLHNVPFSDSFRVHLKYEIYSGPDANGVCQCCVYLGVRWLKKTNFEERIAKNIVGMFTEWSKKVLLLAEREIVRRHSTYITQPTTSTQNIS